MPQPTKIFLCEFITGGGFAGRPLPPVLASEGEMMLQAALADFCALGGIAITVARDPRMPSLNHPAEVMTPYGEPWDLWRRCISMADAALIIAPETGGVLERFNRMVEDAGRLLLGSSSTAVAMTASKISTIRMLALHGVAVPETVRLGQRLPASQEGYVVKPDDGAGSEDTFFFEDAAAISGWRPADADRAWVVQPYVPGRPMSLSLLCGSGCTRVLAVNEQIQVCEEAMLRQTGTLVNACPGRRSAMQGLADRLINILPGLRGFAGVDYIETAAGPVLLEINPRLTTSYAGMSNSLGVNTAQLILDACLEGEKVMTCALGTRMVRVEVPHLA